MWQFGQGLHVWIWFILILYSFIVLSWSICSHILSYSHPFPIPIQHSSCFFVTFPACFQGPRADGHHLWRSILPSVPAVPAIPQTLEVALAEPWDERIFRSEHRKRLWMQPLARDIKLLRGDIYKYNNIYIYIKIYIIIHYHYIEIYKCNQMYTVHCTHSIMFTDLEP